MKKMKDDKKSQHFKLKTLASDIFQKMLTFQKSLDGSWSWTTISLTSVRDVKTSIRRREIVHLEGIP